MPSPPDCPHEPDFGRQMRCQREAVTSVKTTHFVQRPSLLAFEVVCKCSADRQVWSKRAIYQVARRCRGLGDGGIVWRLHRSNLSERGSCRRRVHHTRIFSGCVCDLPWSHCVRLDCALARLLSSFVADRKLCLLASHVRVRVRTGFSLEAGK